MTAQDPIRKLAEELAGRMIELEARDPSPTTPRNQGAAEEELVTELEARLRSAFSGLLGELAAAKAVAERWEAIIADSSGGRVDVLRRCAHDLNSALASETGKLAGKALRAMATERQSEVAYAKAYEDAPLDFQRREGWTITVESNMERSREARKLAADALLRAFLGLRGEVER